MQNVYGTKYDQVLLWPFWDVFKASFQLNEVKTIYAFSTDLMVEKAGYNYDAIVAAWWLHSDIILLIAILSEVLQPFCQLSLKSTACDTNKIIFSKNWKKYSNLLNVGYYVKSFTYILMLSHEKR